jgi:hypothetical protein
VTVSHLATHLAQCCSFELIEITARPLHTLTTPSAGQNEYSSLCSSGYVEFGSEVTGQDQKAKLLLTGEDTVNYFIFRPSVVSIMHGLKNLKSKIRSH